MEDIFIGVDGGATKLAMRIENSKGEILAQSFGGPANITLSVDRSWESIYFALNQALKSAQLSLENKKYRFHLGLGLAGTEVHKSVDEFLNRPHPFFRMQLISDAHAACLGAHQGQEGTIIIAGTGIVGYQIENGKHTRAAGWGFPHDDEGSGAWLGMEAVRLTLQWLDKRGRPSSLTEAVFNFFENNMEKLVGWASHANSSEFARLAPIVIQHSQQDDSDSIRLMQQAARAVHSVAEALFKQQTKKLPCSLLGGIASFMEPWLNESVLKRLTPCLSDGSAGAILILKKHELIGDKVL